MNYGVNANALTRQTPDNFLGDGTYRGRFAPSPTGPLHFGSLIAALASCLEARAHAGQWLVRIDDLDQPRCPADAADDILRTLDAFGFEYDEAPLWQSRRLDRYAEALEHLRIQGDVFPCACSRRELADSQLAPDGASIYPGTCRNGVPNGRQGRAWRVRVDDSTVGFVDAIQGLSRTNLASEVGDFVVRRADGYFAYQLAVVLDDADSRISHVVRGADLFASTPRQLCLLRRLGLPEPHYAHVPVATNAAGEKLSKQTLATPLDRDRPVLGLYAALGFLGQEPPAALKHGTLAEIWAWACHHWQPERIPRTRAICWE